MKKFKIVSFIALAHFSKLLVNLFIMMQIALIHGPKGMGFLGNFMTLVTLASSLAGGGIISGLLKYTSEFSSNFERLSNFIGSGLIYTLISSLVVMLVGYFFINSFTEYIFLSREFKGYIYFFLIIQIFVAVNNFVYGIMNGLKKTNLYAFFMVCGNLLALVIAFFAIHGYGFWGAIIAIAAPGLCSFIPIAIYVSIRFRYLLKYINFQSIISDLHLLSKYSLMLIFSAICFPVVEIIIRNMIVSTLGLNDAGYWLAVNKLSSAYLSFYALLFSYYFVPIISALQEQAQVIEEVKKMIFLILSLFIPMILIFFVLKHYIISWVLSPVFLPIVDWSVLQMIGDLFRVLAWVIGSLIIAKALYRWYIVGEILQAFLFIILSYFQLIYLKRLDGIIFAYISTCVIYCMFVFLFFLFVYMKNYRVQQVECV